MTLAAAGLLSALSSPDALALCSTIGPTTTCNGATIGNQSSATSNLTFNVAAGATITPTVPGTPVVNLTGTGVTLNNNGRVDPALLAGLLVQTTGVRISNAAGSTVTVRNNAPGVLMGSLMTLPPGLLSSLDGNAVVIENGAGGSSTLQNDGSIGANALGASSVQVEDIPVIALRGGARNTLTNNGTITGRVALQATSAGAGNRLTNNGTINGSVNLGQGGLSNSFYASTGSQVNKGNGTAGDLAGIVSLGITYAATGIVDAGTLNNGNTLYLQRNPNAGSQDTGSINGASYVNFNNLVVNSGKWALTSQLFKAGTNSASAVLNGGVLNVDSSALNGASLVTSNGGGLGAAVANATVDNAITLDALGLTVDTTNDLILSGVLSGPGALTKTGTGILVLDAANTFLGGTTLSAGTLTVGNSDALGPGNLTVAGGASLDSGSAMALGNNVVLNASLTNTGTHDLTLGGVLSGNGALIKNGAANLTLNGINTFDGGTTLNAGTLTLGTASGLGSGALTVAGSSTLDTSALLVLANNVNVDANLDLAGNNNLTLGGVVAGAGNLTKNGLSDLTLSGNNSFSGTFDVQAGSLTILGNSALGSNAGVNLGNATTLNLGSSGSVASLTGSGTALLGSGTTLSIGGNNASSVFDGVLTGSGMLNKLGTGTLTLNGLNTLSGNTTVNAGTLQVTGRLDSANVLVNSGATLDVSGTLSGTLNLDNGSHLALTSGQQLSTAGLTLGANSNLDVTLAAPSNTALIEVGGDLILDGRLNVSDAGGFGVGVYRLMKYSGSLDDRGLSLTSVPTSYAIGDLLVQTSVANQVNLLVSTSTANIRFWDGSQLAANGSVDGGSGTWSAGGSNWTNVDGTLNQSWGGDFGIFQGSAGTVTVDGAHLFTGLQFSSNGYQLVGGTAGRLSAIDGSSGSTLIRVDPGVTATIAVDIDGSGRLDKRDSGTLVLNGTNSYTGGTALNGGTLVLGNASALGSGGLSAANGTTLDTSTALALSNTVTLNGGLALAGSHDLSLNGTVDGSGSLTKNGSSTLALNGANTYSGGTLLNSGTLLLGNAGALGSGSLTASGGTTLDSSAVLNLNNAVILAGELTLAGSHDLSLAGVISGSGSLIKQGTSNLTLGGDNSFSGALNILDGSLTLSGDNALGNASLSVSDAAAVSVGGITQLGSLSGQGDLVLASGGELQVGSNNTNSVYDGHLSGAGSLSKTGSGKLVLNGQSSVGGGTQVNAGSLIIGSASGSTASLTSDVQVANGALLGGHGTVIGRVDLASGATLNPGNSIGTLHVDGDVNLAAGSNLEIEANSDGSSDQLISTGTVSLNGANLKVLAGAGDWAPSTRYGILQAAALNGTFASVSSNLAFLTPELAYSATGVELTLERNEVSFVSVGRTYNQRSTAAGIESLGSGTLYTAISTLTAEQAQAAYDKLSGELHASTQGALFDDSRYVRDAIGQRLRAAQGQASTDAILHTDADSGMTFWLQGYGGWGDNNGNSNTASLDHDSRGTLLGIDLPVGDTWRVGAAAGYGTSKLDVDARNSSAEIDSTSLTLFASGQWDALNLRLGASHAWNDIDSSRHVQAGGIVEHDKTSYDANTTQVFGELGYAIAAGDFTLEPFAGLAHVKVDSDSFKEHGGSSALRSDSEQDKVTYGTLGLHASTALTSLGSVPLALQGTLGWQHAFDDFDPKRQLSFAGSDSFTVKGTPLAQDTALAQLGVTAQVASGTTVDLGYSGQFGDGYTDNGVRLGLNVSF